MGWMHHNVHPRTPIRICFDLLSYVKNRQIGTECCDQYQTTLLKSFLKNFPLSSVILSAPNDQQDKENPRPEKDLSMM